MLSKIRNLISQSNNWIYPEKLFAVGYDNNLQEELSKVIKLFYVCQASQIRQGLKF